MTRSLFIGSRVLPENKGMEVHFDGRVILLEPLVLAEQDDGTGHRPVHLILKIDGVTISHIAQDEAFEYELQGVKNKHVLYVKHEFALKKKKSFVFFPESIDFSIDRRPIHHTKADPQTKLWFAMFGMYFFLFVALIKIVSMVIENKYSGTNIALLAFYSVFFLLVLLAERIFRKHHLVAMSIGACVCVIELLLYIYLIAPSLDSVIVKNFEFFTIFGLYWVFAFRILAIYFVVRGLIAAARVMYLNEQVHRQLLAEFHG
jgi:hypothetical protein